MAKRLYVGNLPADMTQAALRDLFAPMGEVTRITVIPDQGGSRPRSLAFVEMAEDAAALQAIHQINGKMLDGGAVIIAAARFSAGDGRGGGSGRWRHA